jgi:hypothetical protein
MVAFSRHIKWFFGERHSFLKIQGEKKVCKRGEPGTFPNINF